MSQVFANKRYAVFVTIFIGTLAVIAKVNDFSVIEKVNNFFATDDMKANKTEISTQDFYGNRIKNIKESLDKSVRKN